MASIAWPKADILEATPDTGYGDPSWTCNYEDCDAPKIGDPVEDWDLFVVTFHPAGVVPDPGHGYLCVGRRSPGGRGTA